MIVIVVKICTNGCFFFGKVYAASHKRIECGLFGEYGGTGIQRSQQEFIKMTKGLKWDDIVNRTNPIASSKAGATKLLRQRLPQPQPIQATGWSSPFCILTISLDEIQTGMEIHKNCASSMLIIPSKQSWTGCRLQFQNRTLSNKRHRDSSCLAGFCLGTVGVGTSHFFPPNRPSVSRCFIQQTVGQIHIQQQRRQYREKHVYPYKNLTYKWWLYVYIYISIII